MVHVIAMYRKPFGIPPRAHWQAEEFQRELKRVKAMMAALPFDRARFPNVTMYDNVQAQH